MPAPTGREPAIGWRLPPFYCPDERGELLHPEVEKIEQRALAWVDEFDVYPNATERAWGLACNAVDYSCRMAPRGDQDILLLFILWNYWATALDDWHDSGDEGTGAADITDHSARLIRAIEAPGSSMLPQSRLTASLDDLVRRSRELLSPYQLRRFGEGARDWLLGASWQTANTERGVMPALNDFAGMRGSVNGTRFTMTFVEAAEGIHLPPDVLYSAPVQALTDAAGFVVSCDNDLFSFAKEDHLEVPDQNLVNVLIHAHGGTAADVLPEAVALRDRAMSLFLRLRARLNEEGDAELRRYTSALGYYITGFIEGERTAPRYASPRNRHPLPVPGAAFEISYRDTPSDPDPGPPPIPSIAWWWEQLRD
ncbi:hypothetical protein JGS22_024150 [Streptomyces sp. P38-E01]|uniref:Terpene synthase n=1 Tax=Streptomyces tardus TaxID=2780544 RepID=A0A949N740_9ACTN|nr:hypothetical protein [Streptomyces tardus]MBU7600634.1 hypothetical protein [Streptomyces tardus]